MSLPPESAEPPERASRAQPAQPAEPVDWVNSVDPVDSSEIDDAADRAGPPGLADAIDPAPDDAQPRPSRWARFVEWWGADAPQTPRQRARASAIRRGVLAGGALLLVGSVVKLPLMILAPGPTYNTIGEVGGEPVIVISGTTTYPTEGSLDMTTVSERGGSSGGVHLGEALVGWASSRGTVVPRETVYDPMTTKEDVAERNDQMFAMSQSNAIGAALAELGIPAEERVVVTLVGGGSPADGIVRAGDVIVAVDGTEVDTPAQVGEMVRSGTVGDTVVLDVQRTTDPDAEPEEVRLEVVTEANPQAAAEDPDAEPVPYMGIVVGTKYQAPFDIDFALENVGGPSAGMMFSLALVDMLTEGALTGGGHVAGTGTIEPDGVVGPIGGIRQKLLGADRAGATLFLAPEDNCNEVVGHEPDGMTVVPIGTLSEARDVVESWAEDADAQFASCDTVAATGS